MRAGGTWAASTARVSRQVRPVANDHLSELSEFPIGYEIVEVIEPELIVLRSDPMPEAGRRTVEDARPISALANLAVTSDSPADARQRTQTKHPDEGP